LCYLLRRKGYNTFVLRYRTGGGLRATEDLAAAISYVFKNADRLVVSVTDYSLWGGSAGARMVGNIALFSGRLRFYAVIVPSMPKRALAWNA